MATLVGREGDLEGLVTDLIRLERDALAAYDSTIGKLSDAALKTQVSEFREDHKQHLDMLDFMARDLSIDPPQEGDAKEWLTTGKIALAGLVGDGAILKAMKTNEDDTVKAYERANEHRDADQRSREFFAKALADEKRHRDWMTRTADAL
ncbi:ferritin-like domain-containing protein [Fulvimarina endophytica]|uniref:Ferritin-like domain-containing protein n=1 Tax=Fulvimarina endophytica TaxID=2293836 RepID=A0A371WZX4_9HYPH|nr:ferritin-like domain-containing protein [Fulvimarina endophytica]RFC62512.1 ferritin-like domain-containing protein [Fulvimarina endophytica]